MNWLYKIVVFYVVFIYVCVGVVDFRYGFLDAFLFNSFQYNQISKEKWNHSSLSEQEIPVTVPNFHHE